MLSFIEKLQKKPEATRRKILYGTVFAIASLIFGVWVTTLPARLVHMGGEDKGRSSPLSSLKAVFGGIFSDFSTTMGDIKAQTGAIRSSIEKAENTASDPIASSTEEVIFAEVSKDIATTSENGANGIASTTSPTREQ